MHSVQAPSAWFAEGASIEVRLPRLLSCARCQGGGCDVCERRGAFELDRSLGSPVVVVTLPEQIAGAEAPVRLRLPGCGARADDALALPNGHLLLTVLPLREPDVDVSPMVRKLTTSGVIEPNSGSRIWAVVQSLTKVFSRWLSR